MSIRSGQMMKKIYREIINHRRCILRLIIAKYHLLTINKSNVCILRLLTMKNSTPEINKQLFDIFVHSMPRICYPDLIAETSDQPYL